MQEVPSTVSSVVTHRNRDCIACRIVSGIGLIGSGLYVSHHSKKLQNNSGRAIMYSIAGALVLLGTARVFDLPPFRDQFHQNPTAMST